MRSRYVDPPKSSLRSRRLISSQLSLAGDWKNYEKKTALERLVPRARWGDPLDPVCVEGTRESVLKDIKCWGKASDGPPIFWLTGSPGTGKSTIARTISAMLDEDKVLTVSSIFCSRNGLHGAGQDELKWIFPTLAVRLARSHKKLFKAIQPNAEFSSSFLDKQLHELIVKPLQESGVKGVVLIIDAPDECKGEGPASQVLDALHKIKKEIEGVRLKVFITSSTEPPEGPLTDKGFIKTFALDDAPQIDEDIKRFFEYRISRYKTGFNLQEEFGLGTEGWPTPQVLNLLCERAGGKFSEAKMMIETICCGDNDPIAMIECFTRAREAPTASTGTSLA